MNHWHSAPSSYSQLPPTSEVLSTENVCLSYFSSLLHVELSSHVLGILIFLKEMKMQMHLAIESQIATQGEDRVKQFTNIMNSCTIRINKAVNDLVQEVWDLQAKERNVLIETVKSLNDKLSRIDIVQNPGDSHHNVVDLNNPDQTLNISGENDIETSKICYEEGDQKDPAITQDTDAKQEEIDPLIDGYHSNDSDDSERIPMNDEEDIKEEVTIDLEEQNEDSLRDKATSFKNTKKPTDTKLQYESNKDDKIKCEQCTFETSTKRNMNRHMGRVHTMKEKQFKCDQCSYQAKYKDHLKQHINGVHAKDGDKTFKCNLCPYATVFNHTLNMHIRRVHEKMEGKRFRCEQCPYATTVKVDLNSHIKRTHTKMEDRKFKCDQCPYATVFESTLTQHMNHVHTRMEDKKFKCDLCSYATPLRVSLTKHVKNTHMKIRDHICENCGYSALEKGHLKKHMANVHNIGDEFKCDYCPHISFGKHNLHRHIKKMHEKIKKHVCEECGYAATQKGLLKKHWDSIHKTKNITKLDVNKS